MSRFYLSDAQWAAIQPNLPPDLGRKPRVDDRRVISGIINVLQSGCRWIDAPKEYGYHTTLYNRYNRWSKRGIWQYLFREIEGTLFDETDIAAIDSTHIKAHRCAGGGKKGAAAEAIGIRRGGRNTKLHAISDMQGRLWHCISCRDNGLTSKVQLPYAHHCHLSNICLAAFLCYWI